MMPTIYVLRHGLSQANVERIVCGGTVESPLTELGVEQARAAGCFLKGLAFEKVFASPMQRVRQTIEAAGLKMPIVYDERLREINYGDYEGRPFEAIAKCDTNVELLKDPERKRPGGESMNDVKRRMRAFCEEHLEGVGSCLIVGHGGSLRILTLLLCPGCEEEIARGFFENASVWRVEGGRFERIFAPEAGL